MGVSQDKRNRDGEEEEEEERKRGTGETKKRRANTDGLLRWSEEPTLRLKGH